MLVKANFPKGKLLIVRTKQGVFNFRYNTILQIPDELESDFVLWFDKGFLTKARRKKKNDS